MKALRMARPSENSFSETRRYTRFQTGISDGVCFFVGTVSRLKRRNRTKVFNPTYAY
ncbi:hypothetical protein [Neisseria sp.]|uniref:hypothetical protein n=1 Tax=Neisseria sp. TaxID=192066 RepID=UPI00359F183D